MPNMLNISSLSPGLETYQRQKQLSKVFYKKGVLGNFEKFTGKHLCQSLCLNKVACLGVQLN